MQTENIRFKIFARLSTNIIYLVTNKIKFFSSKNWNASTMDAPGRPKSFFFLVEMSTTWTTDEPLPMRGDNLQWRWLR